MADRLSDQAVAITIRNLEGELIEASRAYEDGERYNDPDSMAYALQTYNAKQAELDRLTGANRPEPPAHQITNGQRQFLARYNLTADDPAVIAAHHRAIGYGYRPDTPQYESAILGLIGSAGDGRQSPMTQSDAADIDYGQTGGGISRQEYAAQASKRDWLRARGLYE